MGKSLVKMVGTHGATHRACPVSPCRALVVDMARRGLALTELTPRAIGVAAADGEIDAGPIPLVESFRLEDRMQAVAGFCIASMQDAGSSLLFSTKPIEALAGGRIGVTDEASTAPRLLDVLLRLKYRAASDLWAA